jgi:predicted Zn-dependent protease
LAVDETEEALAQFQRELKGNPADQKSLLEIAAVLYQTDSAEGVKYAKHAVQLDPQRPFGHYLLGLLYADVKNVSGAIYELEIAKRSYTNLPEVYFALGNAYARAGRKAAAARARATFRRLNAQRKNKSDDAIYDGYPRGLIREKIGAEPEKNPPEL